MNKVKVLALSGSLRKDSYNRKVLQIAKKIAKDWGAEVKEIDLKKINLPIYDQDIEDQGFPKSVVLLKNATEKADVLLISSPEYNHSIPGGFKNAIDWISRPPKNSLEGKVGAIFGASPGAAGTERMQVELRKVLSNLGVLLLPKPRVFVKSASNALTNEGLFVDEKMHARLKNLVEETLVLAGKVN